MRPTLATIAKETGFSTYTVSLALRNNPEISESTRAIIQAAAERLNYRPNPLVSAHMINIRRNNKEETTATLAYVSDVPYEEMIQPDFGSRAFLSIVERSRELGFSLDYFEVTDADHGSRRLERILRARGISGIILGPFREGGPGFLMDWENFATVRHTWSFDEPGTHLVAHDYFHSMLMVLEQIDQRGYKRPALILHPFFSLFDHNIRRHVFRGYQMELSPKNRIPVHELAETTQESKKVWLDKYQPDVVIVNMVQDAIRLREVLGNRVDEVGIAVLNLALPNKEFAGIHMNQEGCGSVAVDMVTSMLYRNERGIPNYCKLMLIPSNWVDGPSLRPVDPKNAHPPEMLRKLRRIAYRSGGKWR